LELLKLATHLINGLVELMDPVLKMAINGGLS